MATIMPSLRNYLDRPAAAGIDDIPLIVTFPDETAQQSFTTSLSSYVVASGMAVTYSTPEEFSLIPAVHIRSANRDFINLLATMPLRMKVWRDIEVQVVAMQSINTLNAAAAHSRYNGTGVTVAVIDTGIQADHPWFNGKTISFYNVDTGSTVPEDPHGHGTHCAGIVSKLAPGAAIYAIKVFGPSGQTSSSTIIRGFEHAADVGASVVSASLGGWECSDNGVNAPMTRAVNALVEDKGILVCVAAGNSGAEQATLIANCGPSPPIKSHVNSPGRAQHAITVAAVNHQAEWATFSSIDDGGRIKKPDVAAPGVDIVSSVPTDETQAMSGTSMATPAVAGCCACLLQAAPRLTPQKARSLLMRTARPATPDDERYIGKGLVDLGAAVDRVTTISVDAIPNPPAYTPPSVSKPSMGPAIAVGAGALAILGVGLGLYYADQKGMLR